MAGHHELGESNRRRIQVHHHHATNNLKEVSMEKRILLVDDDDSLRKLFGFVLRRKNYEVEEACNGLEGLEKLKGSDFDLLIVDVMMPMLDGIRFLSILREQNQDQTPVLVLTSMDRSGAEAEILAAGATEVAIKPLTHTALLERVERLLGLTQSN
jgi:DNA-binding response OmpR family regulator